MGAISFRLDFMIDLRRLQVLRAFADYGTVTATAAALHLTPSAVSQQLKTLASDLGVDLLRHEGRLVHLTPAARTLLHHADTLQAQWQRAQPDLAAEGRESVGPLRLCGVPSAVAALAAPATRRLAVAHPRLQVEIREEESADCYRLIGAEEADVGIVLPSPDAPAVVDPRFEQYQLLDDPQDLLVPADHPLARLEGVALSAAATEEWIVKKENNDTYALLVSACLAAGFAPGITHQVKEWYTVSALVAEGFGVCLLPRMVPIPSSHAVVRVPLREGPIPTRRIMTCIRRGSAGHPNIAAGLGALSDIATAFRTLTGG